MACELTAGRLPLPTERIQQTEHWVVEPVIGPLPPGTLVVKPFRHVLHVADLNPAETAELGPLLQGCAAAVSAVLKPSQVYVCLWSHPGGVPVHLHFVIQPVSADLVSKIGKYGPSLQSHLFKSGRHPEIEEVALVCASIREHLLSIVGPEEWV
jgi:diadenosine tetraphosphate (Ap4A) HIT family hydrolase